MKKLLLFVLCLLFPVIVFAREVKFEDLPNIPPADNNGAVLYDTAERITYREIQIIYKGDTFIYQIQGMDGDYFIIMPYPLKAIINGITYMLIHRDPPSYEVEEK